jgi:acyl-CoA dehydrogenase
MTGDLAPGPAVAPTPPFTDELEEFRMVVRRWVERELAPLADECEAAHDFPDEVFRRCADQGYLGLKFEEELGGQGGGYVADAVFVEELQACGSGGLAAGIGAHIGIALPPIWKFGTDEQKQRFLVPGIRGEKIAALAITEPDAGSDVAAIKTAARRVDGGWVVNGSKMFITNGVRADVLVTAVKTTERGGHHGISFLLVERGAGVTASPIPKMGWHASDTALIAFDDVLVPEDNLLGSEHEGFALIMANFQWERLLMALGAVGAMRTWFERTVRFARERRPSGAHSPAIRPSGTSSQISRRRSRRAGRSPTTRCACSSRAATRSRRSRWPSCSRSARASTSSTTACRSTAGPATWSSTGSSAPCATRDSGRSAAAPTRSCARSLARPSRCERPRASRRHDARSRRLRGRRCLLAPPRVI